MYIAFVLLLVLLVLLGLEKIYLDRNVRKLKIRVLVNGTRGKSTVVQYVAALLRQNDLNTFSKITGVVPTYFGHDGKPGIIKRRGSARVTEQFRMINKAASINSDAIVLECMSINPELQKLESNLLKPHYYVITNIREDHLEDLGQTSEEWVHSICSAIPANATVITGEREHFEMIKMYAESVNSRVIHIDDLEIPTLEIKNSDVIEDNINIAFTLADELNIACKNFVNEIISAKSEEPSYKLNINNYKVTFINGFAINDVPSAELLLKQLDDSDFSDRKLMIIFNSRADRPMRSLKFAELINNNSSVAKCILTGDHKQAARKKLLSLGMEKEKIILWKTKHCMMSDESLTDVIDADTTLVGLGNIKGDGFEIINSLNKT